MSAFWFEIIAKFGQPHVDVFSPTEYRVWVQSGWHVHDGASTQDPCGNGRSLESACKKLLEMCSAPSGMLIEGSCDWRCARKYAQSPQAKVTSQNLWKR